MSEILSPESARLRLRAWRDEDLPAFAALNADPQVMRYFPSVMTADQSDAQADNIRRFMRLHGWGFWAVEVKGGAPFIGFVGLARRADDLPCSPAWKSAGGWRPPIGATATPAKRPGRYWLPPLIRCNWMKWCLLPPPSISLRVG